MAKVMEIEAGLFLGPGDPIWRKVREEDGSHSVAVLNVADDYTEPSHEREVLYVHAGLNDGPPDYSQPWGEHNTDEAYTSAFRMLAWLHLTNNYDHVYVHCHGGNSRSCTIVAMFLAIERKVSFEEAVKILNTVYDYERIHPKHYDVVPRLVEKIREEVNNAT